MKFEEIYERAGKRELSQSEAAEILGMSERTFRRWRDRFDADGAKGLYDRRLGKVSGRRDPVDTMMEVLELFDTRYFDFTAKHFFDKLVSEHGFTRSYNWVRLTLQGHGRKTKAPRRAPAPSAAAGPGPPVSTRRAVGWWSARRVNASTSIRWFLWGWVTAG